jgi:hypothetical protein
MHEVLFKITHERCLRHDVGRTWRELVPEGGRLLRCERSALSPYIWAQEQPNRVKC